MKNTLQLLCSRFHYLPFSLVMLLLLAMTLAFPVPVRSADETDVGEAQSVKGGVVADDAKPASQQKRVTVMVELSAVAAAVPYAEAYKQAQAKADAARNYALLHPSLKTSKALLSKTPTAVQISATAARQVSNTVQQLDSAQRALLPNLTGAGIGGSVVYRVQRAYNGIALTVSPDKIAAIAALPGVKAVHPMFPKHQVAA